MQPRWKDPMQTPEGELLLIVKQLESAIIKQTEKAGMCKNSMCKNMNCMGGCKSDDKGNYMEKASMDEKNKYCQKTFGCNYSECTPSQKAQCDKHCGKLEKYDRDSPMDHRDSPMDRVRGKNPQPMQQGPYNPYNPTKGKEHEERYKRPEDEQRERDRGKINPTKPGSGNPFTPKEAPYDSPYMNKMGKYASMHEGHKHGKEADRNKNGKIEEWEGAIADKIKESQSKGKETGSYKSDRGQREPPQLKGGKGNKTKIDKTTEFLRSKGIMTKWEQEPSVENSVPTFMAHSGGIPVEAINYHTNGTMPFFTEKAPSISPISEKAKIPAFAKTSYDVNGSSMHMHLNNAGEHDNYNYRSTIEESMMQLKKAGGYGNPGLVEQIASELEVLMSRL